MKQTKDLYKYNKYLIFQPELSSLIISKKNKLNALDITIMAKCIKLKIYKETFGLRKYTLFVICLEETIMTFIILILHNPFYLLINMELFTYIINHQVLLQ